MKVLLGIPHNGTVIWQMAQSAWTCVKQHEVEVMSIPSSLLAMSFNILYSEALNRSEAGEELLFAMLHSDLAPEGHWLDVLVEELLAKDADLISAVNAIKDDRGLTSSGVALPGYPWRAFRRFTMTQLQELPETFNAVDAGYDEDMILLHNTGCWVADIRKPLFHEEDENGCLKAWFTINDRIRRGADGKWVADIEPEDWFYSRRLHDLGAKTYVTRKVVTHHYGWADLDNQSVRGWKEDEQLDQIWADDLRDSLEQLQPRPKPVDLAIDSCALGMAAKQGA